MSFSSLQFLFVFLPIFLIVYFILPAGWRNALIFAASMFFYIIGTWERPWQAVLLFSSVIFNFLMGKALGESLDKAPGRALDKTPGRASYKTPDGALEKPLDKAPDRGHGAKILLWAGIACNLACLCLFKYSNLLMPIGISFYTFRSISYLADVYRREIPSAESFVDFGAYLTFFPQVISGPIEKYREMRSELQSREVSFEDIDRGLKQFTIGLGLKMLLADRIGSCWNDIGAIGFDSISSPVAWMGIFAYSFELYFDFYGYSLMAAGIGRMMGFETPENFTHPYESVSMTEFWRRWHMTLGSWFREYVYIPLGGNRRKLPRVYFNLFAVWVLTGIWHGAGLNFALWGLFLFAVIGIEKAGLKGIMERHRILGHAYMILLIPLSWMIFAIDDIGQIGLYISRLFDFAGTGSDTVFAGDFAKFMGLYGVLLAVCAFFSTSIPEKFIAKIRDNIIGTVVLFVIFWASVYLIYLGLSDPFMYFRF